MLNSPEKDSGQKDSGKSHGEKAFSSVPRDVWLLVRELKNPRDKAIVHLLASLGCSTADLTMIKVRDVQADGVHLKAGTSKEHVAVPDEQASQILAALTDTLDPDDFLFESRPGKPLSKRRVEQILSFASRRLKRRIVAKALQRASRPLRSVHGALSEEQRAAYLASLPRHHALVASFILETGCTVAELVNIRAADISDVGVFLRAGFSKRSEDVTIPISRQFAHALESYVKQQKLAPKDVLFSKRSNRNRGLTPLRIQQMLKKTVFREVKVTPQVLRNTFMMRLIQEQRPAQEICMMLGVKRLNM